MDWIDRWVGVGNVVDANLVNELREQDVDFVMDARTLFDSPGAGLLHEHRPVPRKIVKAAGLLVALSNLDAKVLIHCLEGIDRTPFLAMVYISQKYKMGYEASYKHVAEKRPNTHFHWDWVKLLDPSFEPPQDAKPEK